MNATEQLKQDLKTGKPIYGREVTLKMLKQGTLKKVYLAKNSPDKQTVTSHANQARTEVILLEEDNVKLGILCKKPFPVSILSFPQ